MADKKAEDAAVSNFRQYLRIKTMHPDPDYGMTYWYFDMNSKIKKVNLQI